MHAVVSTRPCRWNLKQNRMFTAQILSWTKTSAIRKRAMSGENAQSARWTRRKLARSHRGSQSWKVVTYQIGWRCRGEGLLLSSVGCTVAAKITRRAGGRNAQGSRAPLTLSHRHMLDARYSSTVRVRTRTSARACCNLLYAII